MHSHAAIACPYCKTYIGTACMFCEPTAAVSEILAHLVWEHWDELQKVRVIGENAVKRARSAVDNSP